MNVKTFKQPLFVSAVLALTVAVSCSKESHVFVLPVDREAPIALASSYGIGGTKGATPVSDASLRTLHYGLLAYWMDDGLPFSGVADAYPYLRNSEVVYDSTEGGTDYWCCSPAAYWPFGGSTTFFGYAPYLDTKGPVLTLPATDTETMPRGRFVQKGDVSEQVDLCLAAPVFDRKKGSGEVPMVFSHALTKVLFFFNLKGERDMMELRRFMLKSLKVRSVVGENSFTYGGTKGYRWDELPRGDLSSRTTDYSLSLEDGTLTYVPLPYESERTGEEGLARYECVNGDEPGRLYLLPQPMTGASSVEAVVSVFVYDDASGTWIEDPNDAMDPVIIELPAETVWQDGKTVCYSATLEGRFPVKFSVTLADWNMRVIENTEFAH